MRGTWRDALFEERLHRLDHRFARAIDDLHSKLEDLVRSAPFRYGDRPRRLPKSAVYVFTENERPLYVGRSNKLNQRLGNHCRMSSAANQSVFAFKLAREIAGFTTTSYKGPTTRKNLMENPAFAAAFFQAKSRLNGMDIRYVEETDQVRQSLLEIYCAVALNTPYNGFGTH